MTAPGGVLAVDMAEDDAPRRFVASFHDTGFAVLAGHGVPTSVIKGVVAEWEAFFSAGVPEEHWARDGSPWGYHERPGDLMPDGVTRGDRKDFYHLGLSRPLPPGMSEAAREMFVRATEVAETLLGWLSQASPPGSLVVEPGALASWVSREQSVLRLQRYWPMGVPPPPGSIRALAHADINLLTLLPAPEVPGLQLQAVGGEWVCLDYDPDVLIVNVGEMLQTASRGFYPATSHRVVVVDPADALLPRWSLPMFFQPEDDVEIAPGTTAGAFRSARVAEYLRKGWRVSAGGGSRRTSGS